MLCPECGAPNSARAERCAGCGAALEPPADEAPTLIPSQPILERTEGSAGPIRFLSTSEADTDPGGPAFDGSVREPASDRTAGLSALDRAAQAEDTLLDPEPIPNPSVSPPADLFENAIRDTGPVPVVRRRLPSLGRRLASVGIDAAIGSGLLLALSGVVGPSLLSFDWLEPDDWAAWIDAGSWPILLALAIIFVVATESLRFPSPGKFATGLRLVRSHDGAAAGPVRRLARGIGAALGLVGAGIGYAWILVDRRQRALHDLLSGSVVVRRAPDVDG